MDVDVADSALLERLPRIGPALAARIVADRNQRGPFGSLIELQRVRGIGPKLAAGLASTVTFSGIRRPLAVPH
ncbi:MAG TPA: helix-hairpin-helix domain-containing protein [Gemmatimonadaceae bacterium]|nr:helix-hairpin-helix domain-containing protein [Gemmatimonadaceae bacterium]